MDSESQRTETYARFSDGASATAQDCIVSLSTGNVVITFLDGSDTKLWSFGSLRVGEPIRSHAIDVLLTSTAEPEASLFVPGADFAAALATRAPFLTARSARFRDATPWLVTAVCLVALFGAGYSLNWSPANMLARTVPDSWRDRLGDMAISQLTADKPQCVAADGSRALAKIAERLRLATGSSDTFSIAAYDLPIVNAFAVPGNRIVISGALITDAETPEEVAGVIAHEMGHGLELHPETGVIRTVGIAAAVELMLGGTGGTMSQMGMMLAQLGYTRVAEREADVHALRILREAQISSKPLARFFTRLDKKNDDEKEPANADAAKSKQALEKIAQLDIFRTHPAARERAAQILSQPDYPSTPVLSSAEWASLLNICSETRRKETPAP